MKKNNPIKILCLFFSIIVLFNVPVVKADETVKLFAVSAGVSIASGKTYIVLYWNEAENANGYNLYRKNKGASVYPGTPINGSQLITPVADCNQLKTIIPEGSKEWDLMKNAFAATYMQGKTGIKKITPPDLDLGKKKAVLKKDALKIQKKGYQLKKKEVGIQKIESGLKLDVKKHLLLYMDKSSYLCTAFNRGLNEKEQAIFDMLALTSLRCRVARGLAYYDNNVVIGQEYLYELRAVNADNQEKVLASNVYVKAGLVVLPNPPGGLATAAGDSKVLCTWNRASEHFSYAVSRSTSPSGTYLPFHTEPIVFDIKSDLAGTPLPAPKPGIIDFQRWDQEGNPTTHQVNSYNISGPANNQAYYYKVACVDILGRKGPWSSYSSTIPRDSTAPVAPENFRIDVSPSSPSLILTWKKGTRDVKGHKEQDTSHTYYIYRANTLKKLENIAILNTFQVASVTADPTDTNTVELTLTDSAAILVPQYGEKDFYYRLRCKDSRNNLSAPSAAISGRVPDTTPPGPTQVVETKGFADHIDVSWLPNSEPDLAGYQVYRGVCDQGKPFQPPREIKVTDKPTMEVYPCDYLLVGQVLREDAEEIFDSTGKITFSDDSVPDGSPICYSFWVRAFDQSRNLYKGEYLCPKPGEHLCQKLYEETPPPVPIISAVKARNQAVELKWVSSPVQDLRCFHVYRSLRENDPPNFVACVYIDGTPVSSTKWQGINNPSCDEIPAEPDPNSVSVSFTDKNLEPNKIYWYRISALDWLGNESDAADLTKIPGISTFTYSKNLPVIPQVQPPPGTSQPDCQRVIRWDPPFNADNLRGFIVFRGPAVIGPYRQVSGIVPGNEFIDKSAFEGKSYWYRVQSVSIYNKLSKPSQPVKY